MVSFRGLMYKLGLQWLSEIPFSMSAEPSVSFSDQSLVGFNAEIRAAAELVVNVRALSLRPVLL